MSDADRERDLRRLERDRRRREAGRAAYFDPPGSLDRWPLLTDMSEQPTMALPVPPPRRARESESAGAAAAVEPVRPRLAVSTAIFAAATGLSRVLGLVREVVSSYYFGASGKVNAFTVAFQLPNLVRALVADAALSSAFVPVFSELLEKGERKRAWRVASTLFWLMLLGLSALTAVFILIAPWVIGVFGNPGHDRALAIGLSRVLFPIVTLLGVSGIVVGILNSYDHFTVPAISPVFWNIAIVAGLAIGVPQAHSMNTKLYVYAVSILVATFIQVFLPMPWLRGRDGRLQLVLDWRDPAVKRVLVLMVPVTLGLGLINVNAVIDTFFASRLIDASYAPTAIQKAFLVYMLPQGMFSVAIATVLFPSLSRFATRGDMDGFRTTVSTGLRQIAFLLLPAAAVSAVLAEPIVRILFQRGHFTPAQTPGVAHSLAAFSAGLVFNGAMLMLNRAFFSLQSNWIPTAVALGNLFLNAVLDYAFYRFGVWGIPLATAVVNVAGTWALLVLLRRRLGRMHGGEIAQTVARVALVSAAVAGIAWIVWKPLDSALGRSFGAQAVSLGLALAAALCTYLIGCRALRVRELDTLTSVWSRLRRT
ncbi:MAG TPA: murein biosynthesis integral membrane protein MurJ [Gaiellaceae bacterium]|nr:murein biosynthesis integral membrane protein MurJ [Gaiellaceae bacterium]